MQKALTILAVIIVFGVTSASACRALHDPNITLADELETSLKYADAVFIGTVDRYEYQAGIPDKELDEYKMTRPGFTWTAKVAVFRVDQWWKGSVARSWRLLPTRPFSPTALEDSGQAAMHGLK